MLFTSANFFKEELFDKIGGQADVNPFVFGKAFC